MYDCLKGLEPARVFEVFGQICEIPHGSKNEKAVSDYIYKFCVERGLDTYQDEANNLIIKKPATPGYENAPVTILQAHMDMVCEKNADKVHDFTRDPVPVVRDGDRIHADGTTLGADDGTGVAFALCVLESEDIPHPALEVVLTTDEEAGMSGIKALDFSRIQGRVVINLDCSDEGIVVGCAGCTSLRMELDLQREEVPEGYEIGELKIRGLKGGHSGLDITKERGNANVLLARMLSSLEREAQIRIGSVSGGLQTNAICREAQAVIAYPADREQELQRLIEAWDKVLKNEFKASDAGVRTYLDKGQRKETVFTKDSAGRLLDLVLNIDCGVIAMNAEVPGVPETSGNIGVVTTEENKVAIRVLYRSCYDSKKSYVLDKCSRLSRILGAALTVESSSPEWEYKADSRLSALIQKIFEKRYGRKLAVEVSHGGNECGAFFRQFPDADIVCTGTQIQGAHTPDESVLVSIVQKEWEMLCLTLKGMLEY